VADLQGILKDKKFQIAAGGGVVLGAVVLLRKGGGGGSTSSTTGTAGGLGTFSDSGMSAYQNLNEELNAGISAYADQLTDLQGQLNALKPKPSTTGGGSTSHPKPVKKPPVKKPAARPGPWGWFISKSSRNTPRVVAQKYGISTAQLYNLNPSLRGKAHIPVGARVKVRAGAGAYSPVKR
jgi:hypothetical protein